MMEPEREIERERKLMFQKQSGPKTNQWKAMSSHPKNDFSDDKAM